MQSVRKYFKPTSVTWLSAVVPIVVGVFMSLEPVHGIHAWADVVRNVTGNIQPFVMINAGLVAIGLRAAQDKDE